MRVINLRAENIKRLVAIDITPEGDVVKITGANAQGKSSVLDSIMYALGGKDAIQAKPVRSGKKNGFVKLDLGDIVVERKFTQEGANSSLIVTNKEGVKFPSPQAVLNNLLGRMTFDPLEYMRMDAKRQNDTLREMLDLDFSELDKDRAAHFADRTEVGRELKRLQAQRAAISFDPAGATEEISSTELMKSYNAAKDHNEAVITDKDEFISAEERIDEIQTEIKALQKELKSLQAGLPAMKEKAEVELFDLEALSEQINTLDTSNKNARSFKQAQELDTKIKALEKSSRKLTESIESIDQDKLEMISACDMPVPGLTFGDNEVLYNGLPVAQASSAEQLKISIAMAMAMNPKIRVLRITDGSLLDSKSMKLIEEMAGENDYQIWLEVVDESGKVGIVIEDGMVKNES